MFIEKSRDLADERNLIIKLMQAGKKLQDKALGVPECMAKELHITSSKAAELYRNLYKLLDKDNNKTEVK